MGMAGWKRAADSRAAREAEVAKQQAAWVAGLEAEFGAGNAMLGEEIRAAEREAARLEAEADEKAAGVRAKIDAMRARAGRKG